MKAKLRAARSLSRREWALLFQAWLMLLVVDLLLRLVSFRRLQQWMARWDAGRSKGEAVAVLRLLRLVDIAARRHFYPMLCLRRALVLQWLLDRQGFPTELRIGVCREGDRLRAHAWLESDGQTIGERWGVAEEYLPLRSWPSGRGGEGMLPEGLS